MIAFTIERLPLHEALQRYSLRMHMLCNGDRVHPDYGLIVSGFQLWMRRTRQGTFIDTFLAWAPDRSDLLIGQAMVCEETHEHHRFGVFVDHPWRRRGAATALWFAAHQIYGTSLYVGSDEPGAQAFFKSVKAMPEGS